MNFAFNKLTKNKRTTFTNYELSSIREEDKVRQENEILSSILMKTKLDLIKLKNDNSIILEGIKGHINYTSRALLELSNECHIFELNLIDLSKKFNQNIFFDEKQINQETVDYYTKLKQLGSFHSCVRVGVTHESSDLAISVGSDVNSFGIRTNDGDLITQGSTISYNDYLSEGDILGIVIRTTGKKESSFMKFYINGKEQDEQFGELSDGKFYLVITLYNKAIVALTANKEKMKFKYYI